MIGGRVRIRVENSVHTVARRSSARPSSRRARPRSARVAAAGMPAAAALALLSGCADAPTAPRTRAVPEPRRAEYGPGPAVTIPIIPDTNLVPLTDYATGLHLPDSSMIVIHVNGAVSIAQRTGFAPIDPSRALYTVDSGYVGKPAPPTGLVLNGVSYPSYAWLSNTPPPGMGRHS